MRGVLYWGHENTQLRCLTDKIIQQKKKTAAYHEIWGLFLYKRNNAQKKEKHSQKN